MDGLIPLQFRLERIKIYRMAKKEIRIVIAVSGGFDPVHVGHLHMFRAAKQLGDELVVIVNADRFLFLKKGYVFMKLRERAEIIQEFKCVDKVMLAVDRDTTVTKSLAILKPDIFANGGDRIKDNIQEKKTCEMLGIKMVFGIGGKKMQSNSPIVSSVKK